MASTFNVEGKGDKTMIIELRISFYGKLGSGAS